MDPVRNPFAPGAGNPPPELAGRAALLEKVTIAMDRIAQGRPAKSAIIVGLRGVGKTVLLTRIEEIARNRQFKTIMIEAPEGKSLGQLLYPSLRKILFALDLMANIGDRAKRGLRVLRSFAGTIQVKFQEFDFILGNEAEKGVADSGDLEADLSSLLVVIAEAAKAAGTSLVVCIDELQYLKQSEFSALIMAIHRINQLQLPLMIVGAGLPQILALAGQAKSYAERLFDYAHVGALEQEEARAAIRTPIRSEGYEITDAALNAILLTTRGYPYFLQQWGYEAWNIAQSSPIEDHHIQGATVAAIKTLDDGFFRVRFDRCTPSEKQYLRALAELGEGAQRSGDIADLLGVKVSSVAPTRSKLIAKGMIYSPQHGDTEFTVPMFDQYLKRTMRLEP
jgi:AAA ATPase domain